MTATLQPLSKRCVPVKFAVVCNPDGFVFIRDGLVALRREIDHSETTMSKVDPVCCNNPGVIGTAMHKSRHHALNTSAPAVAAVNEADDATHVSSAEGRPVQAYER